MGHNISLMADAGSYAPWANVIVRNASRPIDQQIPTNTDILHFQDNPVSDNLPIPYIVTCHGNANYLSDESRRFSVYASARIMRNGLDVIHGCTTGLTGTNMAVWI